MRKLLWGSSVLVLLGLGTASCAPVMTVLEALAEIRFGLVIDEHKKNSADPPEAGVADWFAQFELREKPELQLSPAGQDAWVWQPGSFSASLDAGEAIDLSDGRLIVETGGALVRGSARRPARFTMMIDLLPVTAPELFDMKVPPNGFDSQIPDGIAKKGEFRLEVRKEMRQQVLTWLAKVKEMLETENPMHTLEGRLVIVQDRDTYKKNPDWTSRNEDPEITEYVLDDTESWVSFHCAGTPK